MHLRVERAPSHKGFTEGRIYEIDMTEKHFECFSLEDEDRKLESGGVKVQNATAIPRGVYNVIFTHSVRFGRVLPLLENVPGFSGIRIHSGNSSKDTEGCIIVGSINDRFDDDWVGGSRVAFDRLFKKMKQALNAKQKITIEIV